MKTLRADNQVQQTREYKINSKMLVFLYINDKWTEKEYKATAVFIIVLTNIKYLELT